MRCGDIGTTTAFPMMSGTVLQTGTGPGLPGGSNGSGDVSVTGLRSYCFSMTISPSITSALNDAKGAGAL